MTFVLPGRPRNFQYDRATLIALSLASAPPEVKKKRLMLGYVSRASRSPSSMARGFELPA
jgi:hypothetical protein